MRGRLAWAGSRLAVLDQRPIPHWIILRALPHAMRRRFDPAVGADLEATFELAIRDPHGGEPARYALAIARGSCSVRPGAAQRPGAACC